MKRSLLLALVVAAVVPSTALGADVVLRFEAEPTAAERDRLAREHPIEGWERRAGAWPVWSATLAEGADAASVATALQRRPSVRWAEPDGPLPWTAHTLDDEYLPLQWHLENVGQNEGGLPTSDVHAFPAWEVTRGAGTRIAIMDTGVDHTHPDLNVVLQIDPIEDDGDAYPDLERNGAEHGTMVAGLAAAVGGNGIGVAGVAPEAELIAARILGEEATLTDTYDAFVLAVDAGADVINNSWGYTPEGCGAVGFSQTLYDAVDYAVTVGRGGLGTAVVFSAGNQGCELTEHPLHAQDGVIVVGSLNDRDRKLWYSVWGPNLDVMTSSGPLGGGSRPRLVTTDIVGEVGRNDLGEQQEYTKKMGGTSGAAPVLSGAVALMIAANPRVTYADIEGALCDTAIRVSPELALYDADGWSYTYGCGRVDASAAVAAVADEGPPSAPLWMIGHWAELPPEHAVLRWAEAVDPDGAPVRYDVTVESLDTGQVHTALDLVGVTRLDLTGELAVGWYEATIETSDRWGSGGTATVTFRVAEADVAEPVDDGQGCSAGGAAFLPLLVLVGGNLRRKWRDPIPPSA